MISDASWEKKIMFLLRYAFQSAVHSIWRERNRRRHGEPAQTMTQLLHYIDKGVLNRIDTLRGCGKGKYSKAMRVWLSMR